MRVVFCASEQQQQQQTVINKHKQCKRMKINVDPFVDGRVKQGKQRDTQKREVRNGRLKHVNSVENPLIVAADYTSSFASSRERD